MLPKANGSPSSVTVPLSPRRGSWLPQPSNSVSERMHANGAVTRNRFIIPYLPVQFGMFVLRAPRWPSVSVYDTRHTIH